jgi:hypothetical protein
MATHMRSVIAPMLVVFGLTPALVAPSPAAAQQAQPPVFEEVQLTPAEGTTGVDGPPAPPATEAPPAATEEVATAAPRPGDSGFTMGEGFILRSEDNNYKLRIGMQTAYKVEPIYQDGDFRDRRAFFVLRPIFAGSFFKDWIRFWTSLELASNPPYVLDSYVELNPVDEFGLRIGQQYTLIGRHEQFGPQQILFPEWSPVAEYFWTGRDKGITAWGLVADKRFEYYAGAYGGSPLRQFTTISGNYVVEARLVWNPAGPVGSTEYPYISDEAVPLRTSWSVQGYYGKVQLAEENFNASTFRFDPIATGVVREQACAGADFFVQGRWFATTAEAYVRSTDPEATGAAGDTYTSVGVWGQFGVLIIPRTLDIAVRVNWLDPSTDLDDDYFYSGEAQVAYYVTHSPNLVVKLRYGIGEQQSPGMEALGPVSLFTREGELQIATLQLNLAF